MCRENSAIQAELAHGEGFDARRHLCILEHLLEIIVPEKGNN
jgi:hypothetical protein